MLQQGEVDDRVRHAPGVADIEREADQHRAAKSAITATAGNAPRPTVSKPKARPASPIPVSRKPREIERPAPGLLANPR